MNILLSDKVSHIVEIKYSYDRLHNKATAKVECFV